MRRRTLEDYERDVGDDLELPGINETIREQLLWALISDPHIDASSIDVSVREGTVALIGVVASGAVKRAAGELAWKTPSVADVDNRLIALTYLREG